MNQNEFLQRLRDELYGLPKEEIHDIIQDYKEHFQVGLSKGKSEEEISKELGNPRTIARAFKDSNETPRPRPVKKDNRLRNVLIVIIVILIGLPFLALAAFIVFNATVTEGPVTIEDSQIIDIQDGHSRVQIGWDGIKIQDGGQELNIGWIDIDEDTNNELETITIDEEYFESLDGIDSIIIGSSFIDIDLIGQDRDDIRINYHGRMETNVIPDIQLERTSNRLIVKLQNPDNQPISVRNSNVTLQVFVPKTYEDDYNIASSSGNITIRDLVGDKFNIASSSGDISLDNLLGPIETSSSSGEIEIISKTNEGDIDISTSSGNISLVLGLGTNYSIKATTSSGSFRPSSDIDVISSERDNFEAIIGNGHDTIDVSSSSGNLFIDTP